MVETHATVPKWRGGNDRNSNAADSAVFILCNPVNSAIAEWNRRSVQLILDTIRPFLMRDMYIMLSPRSCLVS